VANLVDATGGGKKSQAADRASWRRACFRLIARTLSRVSILFVAILRDAASRLLRMRSSGVAHSQTLMVRRRASAVSNHGGPDARLACILPGGSKFEYKCFNTVVPAKAGTHNPRGEVSAKVVCQRGPYRDHAV
jgi:hypothetical protein